MSVELVDIFIHHILYSKKPEKFASVLSFKLCRVYANLNDNLRWSFYCLLVAYADRRINFIIWKTIVEFLEEIQSDFIN